MNALDQPIWWLNIIVGSVFGFMLAKIWNAAPLIFLYLIKMFKNDSFTGVWYYYSGGNVNGEQKAMRECRLEVKKGFLTPYIAYSYFPSNSNKPRYKSHITKEENNFIESFTTLDGTASGICRLTTPFGECDKLYGFWISPNYGDTHKILSSGVIIYSRVKINESEWFNEIKKCYQYYGSPPSMFSLRFGGIQRERRITTRSS